MTTSPEDIERVALALLPACQAFGKGDMPMHVARELAGLALAAMPSDDWRPIDGDTPRDGTKFDVTWPDGRRCIECQWIRAHKAIGAITGWPTTTTVFNPQPTHWRPLPSPPKEPV